MPLLSEILLLILALAVLGLKFAWPQEGSRWLGYITAAGLAAIAVITFVWGDRGGTFFNGMIVADGMSSIFKAVFQAAGALTALMSVEFLRLGRRGEYNSLLVMAVLGTGLMAAAGDIVMIYVAVELTSISLYVLVASLRTDARSSEAGLKYFIFGAFSSALILYGMSLIYGLTGQTNLRAISAALGSGDMALGGTALALLLPDRRSGVQDLGGALPHVGARRLRRGADPHHCVHLGGLQGRRVRGAPAVFRGARWWRSSRSGWP